MPTHYEIIAQRAGVCDSEALALQTLGEEIAECAFRVAQTLRGLTDGRMATHWNGRIEERYPVQIDTYDIVNSMVEGAVGLLDAEPLVKAAARLRIRRLEALQLQRAA